MRFNPQCQTTRREAFFVRCFFTYPVILLADNSISTLSKRGGEAVIYWRQDSHGSQAFLWETYTCVCVCFCMYQLVFWTCGNLKYLKTWHLHWIIQIKVPLRQRTAIVEEMGMTCTWAPTDSTCTNTRWPQCGIYGIRKQNMSRNYFGPTQDTTRPLKQGSFALSSDISSFTTL